jgi:hypothetical protein
MFALSGPEGGRIFSPKNLSMTVNIRANDWAPPPARYRVERAGTANMVAGNDSFTVILSNVTV